MTTAIPPCAVCGEPATYAVSPTVDDPNWAPYCNAHAGVDDDELVRQALRTVYDLVRYSPSGPNRPISPAERAHALAWVEARLAELGEPS